MGTSGLIIRRNERHEVSLPARVRVAFSHTELVKLSKGTANEKGWLDVHLIDFSENGLGIVTEVFFPRGCVLEAQIPVVRGAVLEGDLGGSEESEGGVAMLNCEMRVMRVQMMDRRPAYLIGGSFVDPSNETKAKINELLDRLSGHLTEEG